MGSRNLRPARYSLASSLALATIPASEATGLNRSALKHLRPKRAGHWGMGWGLAMFYVLQIVHFSESFPPCQPHLGNNLSVGQAKINIRQFKFELAFIGLICKGNGLSQCSL